MKDYDFVLFLDGYSEKYSVYYEVNVNYYVIIIGCIVMIIQLLLSIFC